MPNAADTVQGLRASGHRTGFGERCESEWRRFSRRALVRQAGLLAVAAGLAQVPGALHQRGWAHAALAVGPDLVHDTLNGLVALVVPGPDAYSVQQGVTTTEPGGMAAGTTDPLIATLDRLQPGPPPFSVLVATILNQMAQALYGGATGPFQSAFANLVFANKVGVFQSLEGDPSLAPLGGALFTLAAFLAYSEAGVFDPVTRTLTGQPVGWTLSGYTGVADGRSEFTGYFQNRRSVTG